MRITFRRISTAVVTALGLGGALPGHVVFGQSIVGTWETSVPRRVDAGGSIDESAGFAQITLKIEQRNDSVFATWERAAVEGAAATPARKYKGTINNGVAVLVGEPVNAMMNRGGEESAVQLVTTLTLKADADVLFGTQAAASADGSMQAQPREFKATRKKA